MSDFPRPTVRCHTSAQMKREQEAHLREDRHGVRVECRLHAHLEDALAHAVFAKLVYRSLGRDQSDSNDHKNDSQDISQALLGDTGRQVAAKYDSWN